MKKGVIGSCTELKALVYLTELGYEVFRNPHPNGLVDVVALDPATGEVLLLDIKTSPEEISPKSKLTADQEKLNVKLLNYVVNEDKWVLDSKIEPKENPVDKVRSKKDYILSELVKGKTLQAIAKNMNEPYHRVAKVSHEENLKKKAIRLKNSS